MVNIGKREVCEAILVSLCDKRGIEISTLLMKCLVGRWGDFSDEVLDLSFLKVWT